MDFGLRSPTGKEVRWGRHGGADAGARQACTQTRVLEREAAEAATRRERVASTERRSLLGDTSIWEVTLHPGASLHGPVKSATVSMAEKVPARGPCGQPHVARAERTLSERVQRRPCRTTPQLPACLHGPPTSSGQRRPLGRRPVRQAGCLGTADWVRRLLRCPEQTGSFQSPRRGGWWVQKLRAPGTGCLRLTRST